MRNQPLKIGFIGTGAMGSMLVRALLRAGKFSAADVWAANRSPAKLESLTAEFAGLHAADAATVAAKAQILFLCVKPADTNRVLHEIHGRLRQDQICVLLTNVFTFQHLEVRLPCRVAKLIPSIAQQIRKGIALLAYGQRMRPPDATALQDLLFPICRVMVVPETQLRIFADVASCGPAFLSACIEELCHQAASKIDDLSVNDLREAAVETLAATAELLRAGSSPTELVQQVAVPGGMTEAGLQALREYLPQTIAAIIEATQQTEQKKRKAILLDQGK